MRICFVTSSYPRFEEDGNARFIRSLAEAQAVLGNTVHVVAPYDPLVHAYDSAVTIHWFKYVPMKSLHIMGHTRAMEGDDRIRTLAFVLLPFFLFFACFRLWWVTRSFHVQVVHAHWVLPGGLIAALVGKLTHIPFILSLHGSDMFFAQRHKIFGALARWVFARAEAVTACSPELRADAIRLGASPQTRLLPYGVDTNLFKPSNHVEETRIALGWEALDLIISTLGRMVPKKGFAVLLHAMPLVVQQCPRARLVLAGDGPLRDELGCLAQQLGIAQRISFAGRLAWDRVPDFIGVSDVFVLPSLRDEFGNVDGLPNVLLEALSTGTPVIASAISGVELAIEHGQNGILTPPGDPTALAEAMVALLKDEPLRRMLGQRARLEMETRFTWKGYAQQTLELMEQAVASQN